MELPASSVLTAFLFNRVKSLKVDVAGAHVSNPTSTDPDPQSTHSKVAAVPHEITNREEEIYYEIDGELTAGSNAVQPIL